MISQDYIIRQINQLTQVLIGILNMIIKLKKHDQYEVIVSYTNEMLKEHFKVDLQHLLKMLDEKTIIDLKKETGFSNEHLEILADIFFELVENDLDQQSFKADNISLLKHCKDIYEFIELDERTYSIDRNLKITRIKSYLN